ncbi:MAG: asparagine--tRNA ligase [Acidobacteria bacterium]|nr:asparagine--tRNA ligase [Acidobacteriota bacterium]
MTDGLERTLVKHALATAPGGEVSVSGWVRTRRDSARVSFAEINDGSCQRNLQAVLEEGVIDAETVARMTTGAAVTVRGTLVPSPASGQAVELKAASVEIVGPADPAAFPLSKKRHSLEYLREIAHLRPRSNTFGAVFRVRNALAYAVHRFFQERGFLWVHTPVITASDCEGAGCMFGVTTLDLQNLPRTETGAVDFRKDFFGKPAYLTVSGQLEAEIFALALSNVYTFGPTFRAENSNTPRHLAEFWMIEPEAAFCDLEGDARLAEDFLRYLTSYVLENCAEDLAFFDQWVEKGLVEALRKVADTPFERVTYTEAVRILETSGQTFEFPPRWGMDIQTEHERYLAETHFKKPVIVTDYPKEIKAFYMRCNEDGKTVRAMDILVPRIGEIIGGSQREERHDVLLERIRESGLDERNYWWYLELRKFGGTPHAGFGLGFERAMMFVTGMKNIRDVIPFPRTPQNAEF